METRKKKRMDHVKDLYKRETKLARSEQRYLPQIWGIRHVVGQ